MGRAGREITANILDLLEPGQSTLKKTNEAKYNLRIMSWCDGK